MDLYTKDGGKTIKPMVEADLYMQSVIFMRENGLMIRLKAMVNICTWMVPLTRVSGKMTNNMGRELRHGLMEQFMMAFTKKARKMERAISSGEMGHSTRANSRTTILKDMEFISGMIRENLKVNGKIIKCMEEATLLGQMGVSIMEITQMIKSMDMVK
jgi:hypothetical protein